MFTKMDKRGVMILRNTSAAGAEQFSKWRLPWSPFLRMIFKKFWNSQAAL